MNKTDGDRVEARVARLERALVALRSGVDWSTQRGGRDADALREIEAEVNEVRESATRKQRAAALEAELVSLRNPRSPTGWAA